MSVGAPQPSWPPPPTPSTLVPTADKAYNNGVYVIQPQPPPPFLPFLYRNPDDVDDPSSSTSRSISPLMAALIATLAAAFLVLFYYTVISRLCRRRHNRHRLRLLNPNSSPHAADLRADAMVQDPTRPDTGLDESFIRQITVFKYKKDDGLVEGTECAVCLTEFNESESLRLMPNCEHAFHLPCIDTWLQSHSNCPLCRSTMNPLPVRSGVGSGGGGGGGGVSVAAMQVQRGTETVLVVREVEDRGEVRVEVVEMAEEECGGNLVISEERENKLDGSNIGG